MFGRPSCSACSGREYRTEAEACARCEDLTAQVEDWLGAKCPASVQGQGGHNAAFTAACAVVRGFGVQNESEALGLLSGWNARCCPPWSERELRHKVREAGKSDGEVGALVWKRWVREGGNRGDAEGAEGKRVAPLPVEEEARPVLRGNREDFCLETLRAAQSEVVVSREWLQARSVCRLDTVTPEFFLSSLYEPGERVLVFTKFASQGQYLWEVPGASPRGGAWRLGRVKGEQAERVEHLPREGKSGVWFLNQPIDGVWREKPGSARHGAAGAEWSRRHEPCVSAWRYMVLESDIKGIEPLWVNFLAGLRVPIVALYTSGGKSVHALVRVDAVSKHHFDIVRDKMKPLLTKMGADPGVFTAVRLTRLPGCLRYGTDGRDGYVRYPEPRGQELIYFNPKAEYGRGIL